MVVLDLIMPGKDGFQVLEELKADPAFKDLVVLVLSNLSQDEDIKRVMDMGATEYLIKSNVFRYFGSKSYGFSIRCVKD